MTAPQGISERDWSDLIDTIIGEAAGEGRSGMSAVAHVILNRSVSKGKTVGEIVRAPKQFAGYYAPGVGAAAARNNPAVRAIAEQVALAAISGQSTDPTGGADHFATNAVQPAFAVEYPQTATIGGHRFFKSPNAKPYRAAEQVAQQVAPNPATMSDALDAKRKSGDQARKVAGVSPPPRSQTQTPTLVPFTNVQGEQYLPPEIAWGGHLDGLDPEVARILNAAQSRLGFPISVISGARSKQNNAAVGGRPGSMHLGGDAVDISMKGLNEGQRAALVAELVAAGAPRLGTYSGNTGLHFDIKDQPPPPGYRVWPMFDGSIRNMANAQGWFDRAVRGQVPTSVQAPVPAPRPSPLLPGQTQVAQATPLASLMDGWGAQASLVSGQLGTLSSFFGGQGTHARPEPKTPATTGKTGNKSGAKAENLRAEPSRMIPYHPGNPLVQAAINVTPPVSVTKVSAPAYKTVRVPNPAYKQAIQTQKLGNGAVSDKKGAKAGNRQSAFLPPEYTTRQVAVPAAQWAPPRKSSSVGAILSAHAAADRQRRQQTQFAANQNPEALRAISEGRSSYVSDSGAMLPTRAMNGNIRNTYGDDLSNRSLMSA